jgi:transposase InsO family protein
MRALDELYTRWPFYGVRRMTIALQAQGWTVNPKRTRRLMRLMGLEAIYPKPRLSSNGGAHPRFPYLLKGLAIERSNQVWCSDITYIGLSGWPKVRAHAFLSRHGGKCPSLQPGMSSPNTTVVGSGWRYAACATCATTDACRPSC